MLLRIDHVGIACRSLEAAIDRYVSVFGFTVASEETNAEQGVREAMLVTDSGDSYVQLLEPLGDETPVGRFIARRGEGLHHVGYAVTDVTAALAEVGGAGRAADRLPAAARVDGRLDRVPPSGRSRRGADRARAAPESA